MFSPYNGGQRDGGWGDYLIKNKMAMDLPSKHRRAFLHATKPYLGWCDVLSIRQSNTLKIKKIMTVKRATNTKRSFKISKL